MPHCLICPARWLDRRLHVGSRHALSKQLSSSMLHIITGSAQTPLDMHLERRWLVLHKAKGVVPSAAQANNVTFEMGRVCHCAPAQQHPAAHGEC